jgi:hypothetical protein
MLYHAEAHMPNTDKRGPFTLVFRPKEKRHDAIFAQIGIEPLAAPSVLSDDPLERLIAEQGGRVAKDGSTSS